MEEPVKPIIRILTRKHVEPKVYGRLMNLYNGGKLPKCNNIEDSNEGRAVHTYPGSIPIIVYYAY